MTENSLVGVYPEVLRTLSQKSSLISILFSHFGDKSEKQLKSLDSEGRYYILETFLRNSSSKLRTKISRKHGNKVLVLRVFAVI